MKISRVRGSEELREQKGGADFRGFWKVLVAVISIAYVAYHLYTSGFGMPMVYKHRVIHLGFVLSLVFLIFPAKRRSTKFRPSVLDLLLFLASLAVTVYMFYAIDKIALRAGQAVAPDYVIGAIGTLLVMEACRRTIGYQLLALAVIMILYAYFGRYMPRVLSHQGYSIQRIIYQMYLTTQGVFGIPLGVSAQYLVLFIFFASIVAQTGLGQLFNDVAFGIAGRSPGGPAKVAIVSSGLIGMIQGGAASNVATTGSLTIPLMKKIGYKPHFAAAVEAAASTGGQFMPPIMGSVAFIMSEYTGIPYIRIAAAAAIPALLYFISVYFVVDFRAKKRGLTGLDEASIPDYKKTVKRYGHMVLPVILLVYLLVDQRSPMFSAFYAIVATFILAYIFPHTRMGLKALYELTLKAARSTLSVAVAMATAGFVVGILAITGLGLIISNNIIILSRGILMITLLLTMLVSILLGMGLPTSACYVIAASIAAGILKRMNVDLLPAHMFILYFATLSTVTPPVALASYVGAGIAGANPNRVGWTAFRMALVAFIIPYFFVYSPAMLLIADSFWQIVIAAASSLVGVYFLAAGSEGYLFGPVHWALRIVLLAGSLSLIMPGVYTDLIGLAVCLLVSAFQPGFRQAVRSRLLRITGGKTGVSP